VSRVGWLQSWCVAQNFLSPQRDQPMLMPVDMRDWLSEDDLVFVVLDAVAALDLGGFGAAIGPMDTAGRPMTRR